MCAFHLASFSYTRLLCYDYRYTNQAPAKRGLTQYYPMPYFDALKIFSCGKHSEKRRNCLKQAISPFLTMFSTLYGTYFSFKMHFKMSSSICFTLDQSKMLSSGNELMHIRNTLYQARHHLIMDPYSQFHQTTE